MAETILQKIGLRKLSPNDPLVRLNTLCPYFTMFPLSFPLGRLRNAAKNSSVLDPFCGRGTTNFAARLLGLPSAGIDSNPVAVAIARAKFSDVAAWRVIRRAERILRSRREPQDVPAGPFWRRCFHPETLEEILKFREHLLSDGGSPTSTLLRALMLGILHGPRNRGVPTYLSNQMPRTYATKPSAAISYWQRHGLRPERVDVLGAIARRAHWSLANRPAPTSGRIILGDSQTCRLAGNDERFSWIVTSPPYLGMRTYKPDQWLRNWFLGGPAEVDYTDEGAIQSQTEATFERQLANVWRNVATVSAKGAKLVIRFGALPSMPCDAAKLLKSSIQLSDSGWRVVTIRNAGTAANGRRQADQFAQDVNAPSSEIDLYAVLEG